MPEEWTFATLILWIEAKLATVHAVLDERAKAITVAFTNVEERLRNTNEWRASFDDLTKTMASKEALSALDSRVDKLEAALLKQGGKAEGAGMLGARLLAALGACGTVFGIIAVILVFNQ